MYKNPLLILFLISSLSLTWGCSYVDQDELPIVPEVGVAPDLLNRDLEITLPSSKNTFKIGDNVVLNVHLKSDIQVKTSSNFDVKIYYLDARDNKWIEVTAFENQNPVETFFKNEDVILDEYNKNRVVVVRPMLEKQDEKIILLLTLKGTVIDGDSENELVGSYVVVTLKP